MENVDRPRCWMDLSQDISLCSEGQRVSTPQKFTFSTFLFLFSFLYQKCIIFGEKGNGERATKMSIFSRRRIDFIESGAVGNHWWLLDLFYSSLWVKWNTNRPVGSSWTLSFGFSVFTRCVLWAYQQIAVSGRFQRTPTESHPFSKSAKAFARRCYSKAGFKEGSRALALWGINQLRASEWQCWHKARRWKSVVNRWPGVDGWWLITFTQQPHLFANLKLHWNGVCFTVSKLRIREMGSSITWRAHGLKTLKTGISVDDGFKEQHI